MKRVILLATALPCVAFAQTQFQPPGGLPLNTPIGTAGDTLQSVRDGVKQNASDIAAVGASSLSAAQAAKTYLPLSGGELAGALSASGDPTTGGFIVSDPKQSGKRTGMWYNANEGEFTIENDTPTNNVLALKTTDPNSFSAMAFVGPDMTYGDTIEHGAIGWGPKLKYGPDAGYDYFEISRFTYDGAFNRVSVPFLWQTTGLQLIPWGMTTAYGVVTKGSNTVTCVGGCNFPGATGQLIDTPAEYSLFPAGTTIASGGGTNTVTMSKAALASSANSTSGTYFRIGNAEGSQHDIVVHTPLGNIDYYRYGDAKWGVFGNPPFMSVDLVNGRLGVNNPLPAAPLDVSGTVLSNISGTSSLNQFASSGAFSAQVMPGVSGKNTILHAFGVGVNQAAINWETNPQRLTIRDVNIGANMFEFRMDGSWQSQQYAHPVDTITANTALNNVTQCGRTVVVNSSSAVTVTAADYMLVGCRITISQIGTGAVTIAPASGLTLGSYGTQAQTGSYTMPGQYSSVVIEAKSAHLATIERGH